MRCLFGQEGVCLVSAMRAHVCLRELRGTHEEMRSVSVHYRTGRLFSHLVSDLEEERL